MGALGHRSAVAEVFDLQFSGLFAWWMWRTIYLMKMPGWGRRLKVASTLAYDEFLSTLNWPLGAAVALTLLAANLVVMLSYNRLVEGRYKKALG